MSAGAAPGPHAPFRTSLDAPWLLAILSGLAAVLTAALAIQALDREIPCPLCLIERAAMFGIAFGLMMRLRPDGSARGLGVAMVFALFLLVVSARQVLLDLFPRPGHAYVGRAVLGLHMPVWSVVVALATLVALAAREAVLGGALGPAAPPSRFVGFKRLLGLYLAALCLLNLAGVVLQCGFGACRTTGYALLP